MSTKEVFLYAIGFSLVCYILGYSLGATKVLLFQSSGDGRNALVNLCDVNGDYVDENNGCRSYKKVTVSLKRATSIVGSHWGSAGGALGFILGLGISFSISEKRRKSK